MFLLLLKGSAQKLNVNASYHLIEKRVLNVFTNPYVVVKPHSKLVVGLATKNSLRTSTVKTAKNTPSNTDLDVADKNYNKNIVLGEVADVRLDLASLNLNDSCTNLGRFAQKISADFAQKGAEIFKDLTESFCLLAAKADDDVIHIAKDPLNSQSIYWVEEDNWCMVCTNLSIIQKVLNRPLRLSERGLSSWLSGYPNPAISLFEEINVLPIGYRLALSSSGKATIIKFWDIQPDNKLSFASQAEYAERFFELLNTSVVSACDSQQQVVASQMSGGLDSTSITALANQHLQAASKKVLPLSHMYTQSKKSDESQLVKDMLAFLNIEQSIQMSVDEGKDRDFLALYPTDLESPGTVLSPRYIKELALVKQAGADVLLTGNGGDEMCWGHSTAYTQRFKQGDWRVVTEVLKACGLAGISKRQTITNLFLKPLVPEIVLKMLTLNRVNSNQHSMPIWLTDKARALSVEETRIDNPFDVKKDPVGYNRYSSLKTTSTYNAVRSYQKVAQQFDINVRHPFFNTQLAEFTFAIPAKQLIRGPYPKWLLRYSMQNHLPKSVCWNLQKTTFDQHFANLLRDNATELRALLQDPRLADMGLVNQNLLLAEFDRVINMPKASVQVDLLYTILTFTWLKKHFPE